MILSQGKVFDEKVCPMITQNMSLNNNGFKLIEFIESPNDISAVHQEVEKLNAKIPLSMLILGQKIARN